MASTDSPTPASARSCCSRCLKSNCRRGLCTEAGLLDEPADSFGEALSYFPATAYDDPGPPST